MIDIANLAKGGKLKISQKVDVVVPEEYGLSERRVSVDVNGEIFNRDGLLIMEATLSTEFATYCDVCLTPLQVPVELTVTEVFSETAENTNDDMWVILDKKIDLVPVVENNIFLAIPIKTVCKEDCKGLCRLCGKNLNEGLCSCDMRSVDERFAVLKGLFKE